MSRCGNRSSEVNYIGRGSQLRPPAYRGAGCGTCKEAWLKESSPGGQRQLETRVAFLPNTHEGAAESNPEPSDYKAHYLSDSPCSFPKS